jgi:hypothetical protein
MNNAKRFVSQKKNYTTGCNNLKTFIHPNYLKTF